MSDAASTKLPSRPKFTIKREIAKAILRIQTEVGTMLKSERNTFSNYDYVPIDAFYEKVAPIANKNGIFWTVRLENAKRVRSDEKDKNNDVVNFDVFVDLIYEDGTVYPAYGEFFLFHPFIGPQTTGSALSYADKAFMRVAFKIAASTEPDADSLPQDGSDRRPPPPSGRSARIRAQYEDYRPPVDNRVTGKDTHPMDEPPPYDDELPHGQPAPGSQATYVPRPPYETPFDRTERMVREGQAQKAASLADAEPDLEIEMSRAASRVTTMGELQNYWKGQMTALTDLKKRDPNKLARIQAVFTAKKGVLLKGMPRPDTNKVLLATRPMQFPQQAPPPVRPRRVLRPGNFDQTERQV